MRERTGEAPPIRDGISVTGWVTDLLNKRQPPAEVVKQRITIRIDEDVLQEFRQLVPDGRGYQRLINQALREWLIARDVKELVRNELRDIIEKVAG